MAVQKIISGGQTGVDRAALDAALETGLETGGWCPPGKIAEDGIIPSRYPLTETPYDRSPYAADIPRSLRTEWNVRDSDGTLIIIQTPEITDPGTIWAIKCAKRNKKPHLLVKLPDPEAAALIRKWILKHQIRVLNIAGPSEKTSPGIYQATKSFLNILKITKS
ncbi:MAG: putative molybdenum carrier protein [Bacteroidales bacterium]